METRKTITLDARAQHRLYVLNHVLTAGLTAEEAAGVLELSVRQVRRLLRRYGADGAAGLSHGNRARVPGHRIPEAVVTGSSSWPRRRMSGSTTATWPSCSPSARGWPSPSGACAGSNVSAIGTGGFGGSLNLARVPSVVPERLGDRLMACFDTGCQRRLHRSAQAPLVGNGRTVGRDSAAERDQGGPPFGLERCSADSEDRSNGRLSHPQRARRSKTRYRG